MTEGRVGTRNSVKETGRLTTRYGSTQTLRDTLVLFLLLSILTTVPDEDDMDPEEHLG